ncbi:SDR family NAD(P)-dependent oxidoreductase [Pareuzebyella sediminis]|uniref:SDR family NAD(P)-dependent oxidoreductase n=1 Tax=Pareuzebyella sediminis TaxID=2607998 RepID=UPI0011ECE925|nr:glucose 1-dehydrogenase [Pareuzebyella sediminis]
MKFDLKGKTAIVTGGGSGIGRAIAITLASQGAHVHIFELKSDSATEVVEVISDQGGLATAHSCNVAVQDEVKDRIAHIGHQGDIDILINNAGIAHIGNVEQTTEADLDKIYAVNIKGVYNCIHAVVPYMKKKGGVILNMASIAATVGIKDRFAYSMSKGAALTMMYSVAKDYIHHNIRCNSISPARIHTPFVDGYLKNNFPDTMEQKFKELSETQPIGRMGSPQEVADLALFLCSEEASFITGTDFPVDGGFIRLNGN